MKLIKYTLTSLILALIFTYCEDRSEITAPLNLNSGEADFSKFIAIGNSLTSGFQSGALYESAQNYSFPNLIAMQTGTEFTQPTISDPGIGGRIEIESLEPLATTTNDLVGGLPTNQDYEGTYNNLGVPGALLTDIINASSSQSAVDRSNLFFEIVLRNRGTVLEQVKIFKPTFATLWIGNNDILGFATSGGTLPYTPEETFAFLFDQLSASLSEENIDIMVANIPNIRAIPYFTTVAPGVGVSIQNAQSADPSIQGLVYQNSGDQNVAVASPADLIINKILLTLRSSNAASYIGDTGGKYYSDSGLNIPPDVKVEFPFGLSPENPFPDNLVLDLNEQQIIENVISSYNSAILSISTKYEFKLVDMNRFFNEIASNGITVNGVKYTTDFISGGLFSLDGVHPSSQGYAIVANKFITDINEKFGADIPLINVATIPGSIELAKKSPLSENDVKLFDEDAFKYSFY